MIREKYDFRFYAVAGEHPVVRAFVAAHFRAHGYSAEAQPSSHDWVAVERHGGIYTVFGWRREGTAIVIDDFYAYPSRWGTLACYAALEYIKAQADRAGVCVVTATPRENTRMIRAYKRVLGLTEPALLVYRYTPAVAAGED